MGFKACELNFRAHSAYEHEATRRRVFKLLTDAEIEDNEGGPFLECTFYLILASLK